MPIKIIIADDHQLFIDGICSILKKEIGISIIGHANNGLQLLKLFEEGLRPDVVLTDIRMPIMDGITATRRLSQIHPKCPVLALSMYDQTTDVREMMAAGAKGYIVKNAGKEEMIEAIYSLHRGKEYLSAELKVESLQKNSEQRPSMSHPLSRREREIVGLISKGRTSMQIAQELNLSKLTVDSHRKNIYKKLGISTIAGLIKYGLKESE